MEGIEWCASAMKAAQRRLEVAADNLANGQTAGFRRHVLVVRENGAGALTERLETVDGAHALRSTGRALDLAVTGTGSLRVADPRAGLGLHSVTTVQGGSFSRRSDGLLVDERGHALVGSHGFVRVHSDDVNVSADGTISEGGTVVARLALVAGSRVQSGMLEASNVDTIGEMVAILEAQRSFETAQKSLSSIDSIRQKATTDVGQVK